MEQGARVLELSDFIVGIPARLNSSRFPGKVMAEIEGKPLIWHVWKRVTDTFRDNEVFICSGDDSILTFMESHGAKTFKSSNEPKNGTERLAELASTVSAEEVINVQADDPTISKTLLREFADFKAGETLVSTPVFRIPENLDPFKPELVKVVVNSRSECLYFSRSKIPYSQNAEYGAIWGHIGIYKYDRQALLEYVKLETTQIELSESLEQLRFLDAGIRIKAMQTSFIPNAIDIPDDLDYVRGIFEAG